MKSTLLITTLNSTQMKKTFLRTIIVAVFLVVGTLTSIAQNPGSPPPPPANPSGGSNLPVGGSAPVGSGLLILLALGAAYSGKKAYDFRKKTA